MHDVRDGVSEVCVKNKNKLCAYSLLQPVDGNSSNDTIEQTRMANEAKFLVKRMSDIPPRRFSRHLNDDLMRKNSVSSIDTRRGEFMHGKEVMKL